MLQKKKIRGKIMFVGLGHVFLCFHKEGKRGGNNLSRGHVFLCFLHKKENKRGRMLVGGPKAGG